MPAQFRERPMNEFQVRQEAIALLQRFKPYPGPLFEKTWEGYEVWLRQSEDYIQGRSPEVLRKVLALINRIHSLNRQRQKNGPYSLNALNLLESAILEYFED